MTLGIRRTSFLTSLRMCITARPSGALLYSTICTASRAITSSRTLHETIILFFRKDAQNGDQMGYNPRGTHVASTVDEQHLHRTALQLLELKLSHPVENPIERAIANRRPRECSVGLAARLNAAPFLHFRLSISKSCSSCRCGTRRISTVALTQHGWTCTLPDPPGAYALSYLAGGCETALASAQVPCLWWAHLHQKPLLWSWIGFSYFVRVPVA